MSQEEEDVEDEDEDDNEDEDEDEDEEDIGEDRSKRGTRFCSFDFFEREGEKI